MQNTQLQKTELLNQLQRYLISTYLLANKKALGPKGDAVTKYILLVL
jgi:hypothetical protein